MSRGEDMTQRELRNALRQLMVPTTPNMPKEETPAASAIVPLNLLPYLSRKSEPKSCQTAFAPPYPTTTNMNLSSTLQQHSLSRAMPPASLTRASPARQLAELYNKYSRPAVAPTATVAPNRASQPSPQEQNYPRYVNGKYVKPPSGLIFGMQPWQVVLVAALGAGWIFGPPGASNRGSNPDGVADPMGVSGNSWAYKVASHPPGSVLDLRRYEELLGALEYHRDVTNLPVVLDVYSRSCGPCRQIAPVYAQLATTHAGKVAFLKVDSTQLPRVSMKLNVRSLPTFLFFRLGQQVHSFAGADAAQLQQVLDQLGSAAEAEGTFASAEAYPTEEAVRDLVNKHTPNPQDKSPDALKVHNDAVTEAAAVLHAKFAGKPASLQRKLKSLYTDAKVRPAVTETTNSGPPVGQDTPLDPATEPATGGDDVAFPFLDFESSRVTSGAPPENVVIIGGGPAGLAAAIYAARAGLRPLVVAPEEGGQLLGKGVGVENFPGIFGGGTADDITSGKQVVEVMRQQALHFGTEFLRGHIVDVDLTSTPKRLIVTSTNSMLATANLTILSRAVILTLGSKSRWLNVPGEELLKGHGVSACATCDGYLYRDKVVAVVGGGDSAMESALVLARTAKTVIVVHRRNSFAAASRILADRVQAHDAITIRWESTVEEFVGSPETGLVAIKVRQSSSDSAEAVPVAACFVAIGHDPNTDVLKGQVPLDSHKYVVLDNPPKTTIGIPGVFAAGDIADNQYRQAITSAGTGAAAALDAERWLSETT